MLNEMVGVSVLLVTYNHEKHIRRALDALLGQELPGMVEVVVADDASTDSTRTIIKEYERLNERFLFKYLDSTVNLGITKNYQRGFAACSGKYVAVLEGDDYWVSPLKLKRQAEFLDNHWECDLCSVNYFVFEETRSQFTPRTPIGTGHRFFGARDLIADNIVGNFSTCMYRRSALSTLPAELFEIKSYDWITNIYLARESLIGYLDEPMSVYRLHDAGVWTQTPHIEKLKSQLDILPAYDELTDYLFHDDFEHLSSRLRHVITASQIGNVTENLSQPVLRVMPFIISCTPPFIMSILRAVIPVAVKNFLVKIIKRSRE